MRSTKRSAYKKCTVAKPSKNSDCRRGFRDEGCPHGVVGLRNHGGGRSGSKRWPHQNGQLSRGVRAGRMAPCGRGKSSTECTQPGGIARNTTLLGNPQNPPCPEVGKFCANFGPAAIVHEVTKMPAPNKQGLRPGPRGPGVLPVFAVGRPKPAQNLSPAPYCTANGYVEQATVPRGGRLGGEEAPRGTLCHVKVQCIPNKTTTYLDGKKPCRLPRWPQLNSKTSHARYTKTARTLHLPKLAKVL